MFIELMPLIDKRAITIAVAALKDGHVRVNIVPAALAEDSKVNEKIGYSNKDKISRIPESAVHALTTPLSKLRMERPNSRTRDSREHAEAAISHAGGTKRSREAGLLLGLATTVAWR
jgi:uncharacterized protein YdaT